MNDKNSIPQADVSNFLEGNASRYRFKSNKCSTFNPVPSVYLKINLTKFYFHHWNKKASKGRFFKPDNLQIHSNAGKFKERKKERARKKKGGEEKKAIVALLVLIMATM